uniref:Uncharacterized protein n=1 Tax=Chenopodium quinoa TaxID=63459 RepID=A0A803MIU2_CHEQI
MRQRHTAKRFINKVLKDLPPQHKDGINDLGFGGFLHLSLDAHNGSFSEELVNSFDPDRTSLKLFNGNEILITEEDVHVVYGLPQGPVKIKEPRTNFNFDKKDSEVSDEERKEREDNSLFLRQWRSQFGLDTGSPTFGVLVKVIEEQKKQDVSTEFLLNFIAAAINCCVMSTDNTSVNFKFLCSCKDITKVSKLDWCLFTKQSMTEAVRKWKKGSSYFTSPLPFMMDYFAQFSTMAATLVKKISDMYAFISMFEDVQIQKELKTIIVDKMFIKYTDPTHVFDESAFTAELNEALSNIQAKNNQNEVTHSDTTASTLHAFFTGENQASQLQNQASAIQTEENQASPSLELQNYNSIIDSPPLTQSPTVHTSTVLTVHTSTVLTPTTVQKTQSPTDHDCLLQPLQRDEIAKLRMEFCGKIVLSEENTCREEDVTKRRKAKAKNDMENYAHEKSRGHDADKIGKKDWRKIEDVIQQTMQ